VRQLLQQQAQRRGGSRRQRDCDAGGVAARIRLGHCTRSEAANESGGRRVAADCPSRRRAKALAASAAASEAATKGDRCTAAAVCPSCRLANALAAHSPAARRFFLATLAGLKK